MAGRFDERAGTDRARTATKQRRLAQRPDGHGPARSHAAERRPRVEGPEGEGDRAQEQQEDDGEEVGRPAEGGGGGRAAARWQPRPRPMPTSTRGAAGKTQLASSGRVRSLRMSLRRSRSGWRIGRAGPTFESAADLAHEPDEQRATHDHADHLEHGHGDDR